MNVEEISQPLAAYYAFLFLVGFLCLGRDWLAKPQEHSLHPAVVLDPWKIRGLDLILIPTFIYLLVFGASVLTLEGYKLLLSTDKIADDHLYIFGFPMHITILASLYGFFKYFNLAEDVPLNPVKYGFFTHLGKSVFYFLAVMPILLCVGFVWPMVLDLLHLPTQPQDLVDQVTGMGLSPMFFSIAFLAVILAPLSEELLFRAFLYRSLKGYVSPNVAALASSLLFAGMHFNWHSFLPLFVLGFWLCRTYEKTGNLWVPIVLHAFFNGNTLLTLMLLGT